MELKDLIEKFSDTKEKPAKGSIQHHFYRWE